MRPLRSLALASAVAALFVPPVAFGDDAIPPRDEGNVRVSIVIGETLDGRSTFEKPYDLVVRLGSKTDLSTGWRVPIPTTRFNAANASDGGLVPLTSYTYQNIGLTAAVSTRSAGAGRIVLAGRLEISTFDAPKDAAAAVHPSQPTIGTISQNFEISARLGDTIRVATGTKPDGGLYHIDVGVHAVE